MAVKKDPRLYVQFQLTRKEVGQIENYASDMSNRGTPDEWEESIALQVLRDLASAWRDTYRKPARKKKGVT